MGKFKEDGSIWLTIIGAIVLVIFVPVLYFMAGCFGGWLLQITFGSHLVNGLNILFNTNRFAVQHLPVVCGALATIGYYFKSTQTNNK